MYTDDEIINTPSNAQLEKMLDRVDYEIGLYRFQHKPVPTALLDNQASIRDCLGFNAECCECGKACYHPESVEALSVNACCNDCI